MRRLLLAIIIASLSAQAFGQSPYPPGPPPPVPALPDSPRQTTYTISGSTGPLAVNFQLYGDNTDIDAWIEVWVGGVRYPSTDPSHGWSLSSPTGNLATIPRPITDAVLTFNNAQTGTVIIVGAQRPRRLTEFSESQGIPARAHNQALNTLFAIERELWDRSNDLTGRGLFFAPGNTTGPMPQPSGCQNKYLGFDSTGLNPQCNQVVSAGSLTTPGSTTNGDFACWNGTNGLSLSDCGSTNFSNAVANTTALQNACTAASGCPGGDPVFTAGVWRLTYGNGNGAEPLFYTPSGSACSLSGGNGDNGSQVKSANGKCWLAQFPAGVMNAFQFGAIADARGSATDNTTAFQNAAAVAKSLYIPLGEYCIKSGTIDFAQAGVTISGAGTPFTGLYSCGHDNTIVKLDASAINFFGINVVGYGHSGDVNPGWTFTSSTAPTQNVMTVTSSCGSCIIKNVEVDGGGITFQVNGSEIWAYNLSTAQNYGTALIQIANGGGVDANFVFADNNAQQCTPTTGQTIANWQSSHSYTVGTVVKTNNAGTNYYLVACGSNGASGATQPGTVGLPFKPYGSAVTDGTVTWYLVAPVGSFAIDLENSAEQHWRRVDMTGGEESGLNLSGTFLGLNCLDCNIGGVLSNGAVINGTGGSYVTFTNSGISAQAGHLSNAVIINSSFNSLFQWIGGSASVYDGFAFQDNAVSAGTPTGAIVSISGAKVSASGTGTNGFLAQANTTKFSFTYNFLSGFGSNGENVAAGTSDFFNIVGNLGGGAATIGAGVGTNKTVSGNF